MADISGHILQYKWQNIPDNSTPQLGSLRLRTPELTPDKITEAFFNLQLIVFKLFIIIIIVATIF